MKVVVDESLPKGMILVAPQIARRLHVNMLTGKTEEVLEWNPRSVGIITNINVAESEEVRLNDRESRCTDVHNPPNPRRSNRP